MNHNKKNTPGYRTTIIIMTMKTIRWRMRRSRSSSRGKQAAAAAAAAVDATTRTWTSTSRNTALFFIVFFAAIFATASSSSSSSSTSSSSVNDAGSRASIRSMKHHQHNMQHKPYQNNNNDNDDNDNDNINDNINDNKDNDDKIIHMELRPTSVLIEERRQRRRRRRRRRSQRRLLLLRRQKQNDNKEGGGEKEDIDINEDADADADDSFDYEYPKEWFHPYSRAVYSTLHPSPSSTSSQDTNDDNDANDANAHYHYNDFIRYRHLSKYEREFRTKFDLNLYPNWDGNYYNTTNNNTAGGARDYFYDYATDDNLIIDKIMSMNSKSLFWSSSLFGRNKTTDITNNKLRHRKHHQNYYQNHYQSRHIHRQERKLLLQSLRGGIKFDNDNYQGIPLSQGYGTHYVHIYVGTPIPQRQSVIVDTGSHFTGLPIKNECGGNSNRNGKMKNNYNSNNNCGEIHHTDQHFDTQKSKSFYTLQCPNECVETNYNCELYTTTENINTSTNTNTNQSSLSSSSSSLSSLLRASSSSTSNSRCIFKQAYTEGSSWTAYQCSDNIYCGNPAIIDSVSTKDTKYSIKFIFGCLTENTGLFVTQLADGIMGMSAHELTLPKQLYNANKIQYNMFSMCFRKELGTSKHGVLAGSLTIGGTSIELDTSPMVYAKNIQPYGWYTVYINNIYLSTNGGTSFLFNKPIKDKEKESNNNIIYKITNTFDPETVNKGRGVIVDSGTTDTYISSSIRDEFCTIWKKATGMEYSNGAVYLTQNQLKALPTLLIQLQGVPLFNPTSPTAGSTEEDEDDDYNNNDDTIRPVIGQVGYLDVERWSDVLLAIPATSYMEYSPTLKVYTSRLFFTETRGGVLGANSMQGHNVLFDWQHSRIGFAQSTCNYDLIPNKSSEKFKNNNFDIDDKNDDENDKSNKNCILNHEKPPILSQSCYESVILNNNIAICEASDNPTNVEISAYEIWTLQIEQILHNSNGGGSSFDSDANDEEEVNRKNCETAMKEWSESQDTINSISDNVGGGGVDGDESVITNCNDGSGYAGLCQEYRPCHVSCIKAIEYNNKRKRNNNGDETGFTTDNGDADFFDETVTIPHDIIDSSYSSTTKKKTKNKTSITNNHEGDGTHDDDDDIEILLSCNDWMWSVCDKSCSQSRIISKSKIVSTPTTETGRYCIESSRETRSCHVDECGRNDPCVVPFLVHAIFILEHNTTTATTNAAAADDDDDRKGGEGDGTAATTEETERSPTSASLSWVWTPQVEELFRKQLTLAAHNPNVVSPETLLRLTKTTTTSTTIQDTSPTLLFEEGDVNVLVARPKMYADDDNRDDDGNDNGGEIKRNADGDETPNNNNDNPTTITGDDKNNGERLRIEVIVQISISNPKAIRHYQQEKENKHHRMLLQEVGVIWSNFTNKVFRKSKPTSICDQFDLYPLAKISNEVADNILTHPIFLSLLGDGMSPLLQNMEDENTASATSTTTTTLSARLVSSWTIGTQIYDDYVNYLGPLASTPLFVIIKFFHETFLLISFGWLGLFLLKSIRLCRVCGIRIIKKYWNPNIYDPITQDDKEEEGNDNDNDVDDECCDGDVTYDDGIELTATYLRSKATKRRTSVSKGS